jgi:diadenylate cyclase
LVLFKYAFLEFNLLDLLDIVVVAMLIYSMLRVVRGSRAISMALGLISIVFLAFISVILQLQTLGWIISRLGAIWLIAFIIVFQPELRTVLTTIGNNPLFRKLFPTQEEEYVDDLIRALEILKKARTGALIVIKRDVGLRTVIESGKQINARLTPDLLVTIFAPHTPLHDGAVVIEKGIIVAAACQLPMTDNPKYQLDLGMRHRAGIGLSEVTDAVSIIVSEETGTVSMALRGHLRRDLSFDTLRKLLKLVLSRKKPVQ